MSRSLFLELRNITLRFDKQPVLDDFNLELQTHERLVIMGSSGEGKSTILRIILGILQPQKGSVIFQGKDITRLPRRDLDQIRTKMGMVYQYSALISSLTVEENLALPLQELTNKSEEEIGQIVHQKLELVGLTETKKQLPSELSGGMRKRISLARALVLEPELILFDEPSAGLDPVTSSLIDEQIIRLTEQSKATSIIVTHEMESAFRIGTRLAMLHKGKIILEDTPESFRETDNPIVSQFLKGEIDGPLNPRGCYANSEK